MKYIIILVTLLLSNAYAVKCADFNTQAEAQKYYESGKPGGKRLDGDKDGEACECLFGDSHYYDSICKRFRKKYGK